jgi:hypothetical protein
MVFKYEDDEDDEMVGPVWIDSLAPDGSIASTEALDWMTLTAARKLAAERGCGLLEDTGE